MADDLNGINLKELDSAFGGTFPADDATPNKSASDRDKLLEGVNIDELDKHFGDSQNAPKIRVVITGKPKEEKAADDYAIVNPDLISGTGQGLKDVLTTGAKAIGWVDSKLSDAGAKRYEEFNKSIETQKAALPVDSPAFDVGRIGGQTLATAPLMPVKAFQAINAVGKMLPYAGKPLAAMTSGALGGGIFGAATNSANDEGLASNVGTNAAYGVAAGPIAELGARAAGKALTSAKDISNAIKTNYILRNSGIEPSAARNILARLTDAGYTPAQVQAELQRMGPEATIADLTPALTAEAGGLAARGGIPTDILKGRYGERAAGANSAAHDIMERRLGIKPDYEAEVEAARAERERLTTPDYDRAKASNMALDVRPVVNHIANELKNAVGPEASYLKDTGSYLFDNAGNLKTDTAPLHKVRIAIDAEVKKLEKAGAGSSPEARALNNVRSKLDDILKTNPDMATADAKFAKLAEDAKGLDIGKEAIGPKGNYDSFAREFTNASPEKQEFLRKGLRIQIGDLMDKATRGELSEAQRLFGKSSKNRNIIKLAFGKDGEEVLNALEKEAKFRGNETSVKGNSLTAERRAIQDRPEYGGAKTPSILGDALIGTAMDASAGSLGAGTAIMAGKRTAGNILSRLSDAKVNKTVEGTADLLSRQEKHGRTIALDLLESVGKIRSANNRKLPVDYSGAIRFAPLAIPSVKKGYQKINGISEQ